MFQSRILLSVVAALVVGVAAKPCPILGPAFPAPTGLSNCSVFQDAVQALKETLDNITETGVTPLGPWASSNNSFSIGVFDTTSPDHLFSYQYTSPVLANGTEGVTAVTEESVYRIGSLSKLITAYLFMINAGPSHWQDKITEHIPELSEAAANCSATDDPIDCVDWDIITLGELASHLAGVPRDYSTPAEILDPLTLGATAAVAVGLPPLPATDLPSCGLLPDSPCNVTDYVAGLMREAPIFAPATTPIYSNAGYALLGAALEKITGRSLDDMSTELFKKLNMTKSSYSNPTSLDDAVIPLGVASGFQAELGALIPAGGYFSTQTDLVRLGQSLLASTQLSSAETRQWMKPSTYTSAPGASVGMPWEITQVTGLLNDRVFDLYTKTGDVLAYSSHLILAPDYNLGYIILAAGNDTTTTRMLLADVVAAPLFAAAEKAARQQAHVNFAGTYKSTDDKIDSEIVLVTERGLPGLKVTKWTSNGTDTFTLLGGSDIDVRLYPTNLVQSGEGSSEQIAYRAVKQKPTPDVQTIFTECQTWASIGSPMYGSVSLDEMVFTVENGKAVSITPKAWRITLVRVE